MGWAAVHATTPCALQPCAFSHTSPDARTFCGILHTCPDNRTFTHQGRKV